MRLQLSMLIMGTQLFLPIGSIDAHADSLAPMVTITDPAATDIVSVGGFSFSGTATDLDGIGSVRIYAFDEARSTYTVINGTASYVGATSVWTFPIQASHVSPGSFLRLWVQVADGAGNASPWQWRRVNVSGSGLPPPDTTPPLLTVTTPTTGAQVSSQGFAFGGTVTDVGGVRNVTIYIYDEVRGAYTMQNVAAAHDQTASTWSVQVQPAHVTQGGFVRLWVQANDVAGNRTPWQWRRVEVETLGPSRVTVDGTRLLLARRERNGSLSEAAALKLRGVNYSPVDAGETINSLESARHHLRNSRYVEDFEGIQQLGANVIRTYVDFGVDDTATQILNEAYQRHVMVIITLIDLTPAEVTNVVTATRNHPALLMWMIGNEWNLNLFYDTHKYPTIQAAAAAVEVTAQLIHLLDPYHPVSSSLGFLPDQFNLGPAISSTVFPTILTTAPSVDLWGFNVYRAGSLDPVFLDWSVLANAASFTGPMFFSEFGTDGWNHQTGRIDDALQTDTDVALWDEIHRQLSANRAGLPCVGGIVFEWNDEWWKAPGSPWVQDHAGFSLQYPFVHPVTGATLATFRGHPDGFTNEEDYGLVTMNRQRKPAFTAMQTAFRLGTTRTGPVTVDVTSVGNGPAGYAVFTKRDLPIFVRATPGVHVMTVDQSTGMVKDFQSFDTVAAPQTACQGLLSHVTAQASGDVVLAAVSQSALAAGTPMTAVVMAPCVEALTRLGAQQPFSIGERQGWALIATAGSAPVNLAEHLGATPSEIVHLRVDTAIDADRDGLSDAVDPDDDNDGVSDVVEASQGTDLLDANQH